MSIVRKYVDAELPDGWRGVRLGDVATLQRGIDLPEADRVAGQVPVYGSNGLLGYHDSSPIGGPGVITGRSGSIGFVYYCGTAFWPLNTTLYVKDFHGNNKRYAYHLLSNLHLERFSASTGVPSLNRNFVHPYLVTVPPLSEQRAIADMLDSIDEAIERTEAVFAATETLRDSPAPRTAHPRRPRLAYRMEGRARHRHHPRQLGGRAAGGSHHGWPHQRHLQT